MEDNSHPSEPEQTVEPGWLSDPEIVVFGGKAKPSVGTTTDHGFGDFFRGLVARPMDEVKQDWEKVLGQIQQLLSDTLTLPGPFELSEVGVELGFSAQGKLVFIAEAGVEASFSATFTRKGAG